ncbi:MAG TPA: hypothetical protein VGG84_04315 [Gemmatimonadaceae bacterium]|jgi:hypothetical protein
MEQAQHQQPEPRSARYDALVAEIVPKLRRLGPQLSEQTLLQTAERLAAHRLASEQLVASGSSRNESNEPSYPSFASLDAAALDAEGGVSPLDDANVRHLAVSLTHRMRSVSLHLSEGELVSLATRMAVLEASSPSHTTGNGNGSPGALTNGGTRSAGGAAGPAAGAPGGSGPGSRGDYDAATVTAMAELYAKADAALTTYPWLGLFAGASLGYLISLVAAHGLELRVDNAITTSVVFVLFGATIGLLLGRAKGNIESHRLREDARATLAAADRKRTTQE